MSSLSFDTICNLCSYRMPDLFPDGPAVRELQQELDKIIEEGVRTIAQLFKKPQLPQEGTTNKTVYITYLIINQAIIFDFVKQIL